MKGKFGPYIKYKTVNATIPDNIDPEEIEIEVAIDLINKKIGKNRGKKRRYRRKNLQKIKISVSYINFIKNI